MENVIQRTVETITAKDGSRVVYHWADDKSQTPLAVTVTNNKHKIVLEALYHEEEGLTVFDTFNYTGDSMVNVYGSILADGSLKSPLGFQVEDFNEYGERICIRDNECSMIYTYKEAFGQRYKMMAMSEDLHKDGEPFRDICLYFDMNAKDIPELSHEDEYLMANEATLIVLNDDHKILSSAHYYYKDDARVLQESRINTYDYSGELITSTHTNYEANTIDVRSYKDGKLYSELLYKEGGLFTALFNTEFGDDTAIRNFAYNKYLDNTSSAITYHHTERSSDVETFNSKKFFETLVGYKQFAEHAHNTVDDYLF